MTDSLSHLPFAYANGETAAITSVCSAHDLVIEAACRHVARTGGALLIEATCNQVNHEGGYTGMTPAVFARRVAEIAARTGFAGELILGGDHLGPNPWKSLVPEAAMARAEEMVAAYVEAGFVKIHLDASMACAGDPSPLPKEIIAGRAATLAQVAELAAKRAGTRPLYVIGTEVPVPGGALEALDTLAVTPIEEARETVEMHRLAFERLGIAEAMDRVIGLVVQPGVEFGSSDVVIYDRQKALALRDGLSELRSLVYEAHSTDYQPREALLALAEDGFAIQKVGPWLTFALREALYGLDQIAQEVGVLAPEEGLKRTMEALMLDTPGYWEPYYQGSARDLYIARHYSYSDRIRYYWTQPRAKEAVERLFLALDGSSVPEPLLSQFLPNADYSNPIDCRAICTTAVETVLEKYAQAQLQRA